MGPSDSSRMLILTEAISERMFLKLITPSSLGASSASQVRVEISLALSRSSPSSSPLASASRCHRHHRISAWTFALPARWQPFGLHYTHLQCCAHPDFNWIFARAKSARELGLACRCKAKLQGVRIDLRHWRRNIGMHGWDAAHWQAQLEALRRASPTAADWQEQQPTREQAACASHEAIWAREQVLVSVLSS